MVLGPVLFLLYSINLSVQISAEKVIQFGDDTNLIFQADSINNLEMKPFVDYNVKSVLC